MGVPHGGFVMKQKKMVYLNCYRVIPPPVEEQDLEKLLEASIIQAEWRNRKKGKNRDRDRHRRE
jgi:hypothetical protein